MAAGRLQVGELVSLVNYLMQILMSLMMLSMIIMNIARASASSDRVLEVLGTEPSLKDSPGASAVVRRGAVEFRNVSFRYGGGETDVLHGISFSVAPGMTVVVAERPVPARVRCCSLFRVFTTRPAAKCSSTGRMYATILWHSFMRRWGWCCRTTSSSAVR